MVNVFVLQDLKELTAVKSNVKMIVIIMVIVLMVSVSALRDSLDLHVMLKHV